MMFALCWHPHGGSGLGLGWEEALELAPDDRTWLLTRIAHQRAHEAEQIRKARG
jgi:hypothetical protein